MMHVEGKGNRPMYQNTSMEPELSDLKLSYQDGKWFTYPHQGTWTRLCEPEHQSIR